MNLERLKAEMELACPDSEGRENLRGQAVVPPRTVGAGRSLPGPAACRLTRAALPQDSGEGLSLWRMPHTQAATTQARAEGPGTEEASGEGSCSGRRPGGAGRSPGRYV